MTIAGHSRTYCSASQPQVARNVAGTFDYGYIARLPESNVTPNTFLFRRDTATNAVVTFDPATITGNPFRMPLGNDAHFTLAVMPDVDENVWVIGNGHAQPFAFGYSQWPPTPTSWTFPSFASMPYSSTGIDMHTYNQFVRAADGTIYCCMEQEENAGYEMRKWTLMKLAPHSLSWQFVNPASPVLIQGNHPALSTEPDRCYAHLMLDGTRLHLSTVFARVDEPTSMWWRQGRCYLYSDPPYTTWRDITGTPFTLPLTWNNRTPALIASQPTWSISEGQVFCVDNNGYPHMIVENTQSDGNPLAVTPYIECYWDGAAWQQRAVYAPGSSAGPGLVSMGTTVWSVTTAGGQMRLRDVVSHQAFFVGGAAPNGSCMVPDPIGMRDRNRLTWVVANGDTPAVYDTVIATPNPRVPG